MPVPTAVLIMAYGTSPSLEEHDIRAYLRHILQFYQKTDPTDEEVQNLKHRLEAAGGSPLYDITERIAHAVQRALDTASPDAFHVRTAMKHSPPFIEDVVEELGRDGHTHGIGVALAPFRSRLSTDGYYKLIADASAAQPNPMTWSFVESWNLHPRFLELWEQLIRDALESMPRDTTVVFTNHSLPTRVNHWNDPYPGEFEATARALAARLCLPACTTAYQSAGGGNQPWLGPDVGQVIGELVSRSRRNFLAAPIGFLMDHLEVRYDLDIEGKRGARNLGATLERTKMPNDDPLLVGALVDAIERANRRLFEAVIS